MGRPLLEESRVDPAIRAKLGQRHADIVREVEAACAAHPLVVVGMGINPFPRKARKLLDDAGVPYHYLGYGNYLSLWRRRLALKMWSGWSTFPMVFVKGVLIGGYSELEKLHASGELKTRLQ
ncbi:MAG TPA: glutaredoxin domain-containing protein [Burkholderiaceae bacterium]|nr:glutaredoxin domain-containing protein [Burkholderiaceae bacterium]